MVEESDQQVAAVVAEADAAQGGVELQLADETAAVAPELEEAVRR